MAADPLHPLAAPARNRRTWVSVALGVGVLASLVGLRFLTYSNDIALMLPSDPGVQRTLRFLHESSLSQEVVLSLALNKGGRTTEDLIGATDDLIRSLKSPLIGEVAGTIALGAMELSVPAGVQSPPLPCG